MVVIVADFAFLHLYTNSKNLFSFSTWCCVLNMRHTNQKIEKNMFQSSLQCKKRKTTSFSNKEHQIIHLLSNKIKWTKYCTDPINCYFMQMFELGEIDTRQGQILRWLACMLLYYNWRAYFYISVHWRLSSVENMFWLFIDWLP